MTKWIFGTVLIIYSQTVSASFVTINVLYEGETMHLESLSTDGGKGLFIRCESKQEMNDTEIIDLKINEFYEQNDIPPKADFIIYCLPIPLVS